MNKRSIVVGLACLVFFYALFSLYRIGTTFAPDFSVFYDSAKALLTHQNPYQLSSLYTGLGYPPFTLLAFMPFTVVPYPVAQVLWVLISFSLFLASIYFSLLIVRTRVRFWEWCLVFVFGFLAFPIKFTLGMGQINFAALTLLLVSLLAEHRKRHVLSGVAFGALLMIKPHFALFIPVYLLTRAWIPALIGISVVSASAAITGILFGWASFVYYMRTTLPPLMVFSGRDLYYNQGLGSFLSRVLPLRLAGDFTQWGSLLLVVSGVWFVWKKRLLLLYGVLVFLPIFLLIEPLSWQHHYVFLLPVYVWAAWALRKNILDLVLLGVSYVLVGANISHPTAFAFWPGSAFLLSHVFWGNCMLLSLVLWII